MYYRYNKPKLYPKNGQDTEYYAFEDAKELDTFVFKSTNRQKVEPNFDDVIVQPKSTFETKIDPKTVSIDPNLKSTGTDRMSAEVQK